MPEIGQSLSHYSITGQLGKGGRGEVYRATDSKLGRNVAIKILPEEFAIDADRVARFQREAKLLACLKETISYPLGVDNDKAIVGDCVDDCGNRLGRGLEPLPRP